MKHKSRLGLKSFWQGELKISSAYKIFIGMKAVQDRRSKRLLSSSSTKDVVKLETGARGDEEVP